MSYRILFVCLGNICRSPTADGITRAMAAQRGLDVAVDGAGTGDWHVGDPPDPRMQAAAARAGYDLSPLRARQAKASDFDAFDVIYAMDSTNLRDLEALRPKGNATPLRLFRSHDPQGGTNVPDPYLEGNFDAVVQMVERTVDALLDGVPRA